MGVSDQELRERLFGRDCASISMSVRNKLGRVGSDYFIVYNAALFAGQIRKRSNERFTPKS